MSAESTPPKKDTLVVARSTTTGKPVAKKVTIVSPKLEELVASTPSERNWRGILIALLVIVAVLGLIVFSIFLLSPEDEAAGQRGRKLVLEDVLGRGLRPRSFNGTWLSDSELVYRASHGGMSILTADNLTTRNFISNHSFRQLNAERCLVSSDHNFVLLLSEERQDSALYHVYDVVERDIFSLSPREDRPAARLQVAMWGPRGAAVAFVHHNDLYYKARVQHKQIHRITNTGRVGLVYHAVPDWLYASRGLKGWGKSLVFSPDGESLAFMTYNDSQVGEYKYTWFGDKIRYPEVRSVRYPKANTLNPEVSIHVVNLSRLKTSLPVRVKPPPGAPPDCYVGALGWGPRTEHLTATWINREQKSATVALCSPPKYECKEIFTENASANGWVEPTDAPIFSRKQYGHNNIRPPPSNVTSLTSTTTPDPIPTSQDETPSIYDASGSDTTLLQRLPVRDGVHGNYRHLCLVGGRHVTPLTMGRFEVAQVLGWDEDNELVYFIAIPEHKAGQRHLYRISLHLSTHSHKHTDMNVTRPVVKYSSPQCMTCPEGPFKQSIRYSNRSVSDTTNDYEGKDNNYVSQENEDNSSSNDFVNPDIDDISLQTNCLYNNIKFSPNFTYYIQECLGPDAPSVYLVETLTNTRIAVLDSGAILRDRISDIAAPQIKTFEVEIQDGYHAQVRLYLPPGMKEDEEATFPLILHVDGFPGSQLVTERFNIDWNWYLSSGKGFLVAEIDGRGSGGQGDGLRQEVRTKLGAVDVEDQLAVLTYLRDTLKFIEPARVCVWGWGYGGYVAAMMLAQDSHRLLTCAASVNPPTSWTYQDSFFTERYMGLGQSGESFRAFEEADLTKRAGNLEGRSFMLVHGSADTEVHAQHAALLVRALTELGVMFRHQMYPDAGHTMSGVLPHLYQQLEGFFDDCFKPKNTDTISDWDVTGSFFTFRQ